MTLTRQPQVCRLWRSSAACAAQAEGHVRHVFDSAAASPASFAAFCDELADFLAEACFMQASSRA